jgi:hypothetical protein
MSTPIVSRSAAVSCPNSSCTVLVALRFASSGPYAVLIAVAGSRMRLRATAVSGDLRVSVTAMTVIMTTDTLFDTH